MLEKRYDDAKKYTALIKELEDKEAQRLTTGLFGEAYVKAIKSGAEDINAVFKKEYAAQINALPYDIVEANIKSAKGRAEIFSENLILGIIDSRIQPTLDQSGGEMSKDIASSLLSFSFMVKIYMPFKNDIVEVLTAYLDANKIEKEDIWTERDFTIEPGDSAKPVTVCIWDSGLDTTIFSGRLWVNENEIFGNNIDDDNNGYIDDVNGIGYTLHSDKTSELLFPIGDIEKERPQLQRMMKGLEDISSNIESEEATELKQTLAGLDKTEVKPFIENIARYGNHAHGTHVAGIAARGNAYIRLMPSRLTFGYTMIPEEPTIEQAIKDSVATVETLEYYRKNGVRVVNMSWGGDLASIESALETNNAGGTPEERKALARQIFEIGKSALYEAIKNAPEILFITSAGNADNDVTFEEFIPSTFDLPNIMSIGAVDQAGEETGFTSFGKVDVYANGFEVLSYVPGGDEMKMSGTSMSSPNVTNLAAKLLALKSDLTALQVRELIEKGCDEKMAGERKVLLINPKKSMELLAQMK